MTPKITLALSLALAWAGLVACAKPTTAQAPNLTQPKAEQSAPYQLTALDMTQIGFAKQIAFNGNRLLIINEQGELWQWGDNEPLLRGVSDMIAPVAGFGKVAVADKQGNFTLLANGKTYHTDLRLSPNSGMIMLPLATIAVHNQNDTASLVRLELVGDDIKVTARFDPILPDARPVQVNFDGDNQNGHIAVLSHPDRHTYRHGVLGDDIEAGQLQFLERHTLRPLANALHADGLVFEANTLEILPHSDGNHLISTISGNNQGARTVIIDKIDNQLTAIAQSTPLPPNRWQSPFVLNQKLYAVQMPHLIGRLVQYTTTNKKLQEKPLGEGFSNHAIGDFDTNLVASTDQFAVVPQHDLRRVGLLMSNGDLHAIPTQLSAPITQTIANQNQAYLLLLDGNIWTVKN